MTTCGCSMILAVSWTFCQINFLAFDKEDSANDDAFSAMGSVSSSIVDFGTIIVKFSVDSKFNFKPKAEDGKEEQEKNGADEGK